MAPIFSDRFSPPAQLRRSASDVAELLRQAIVAGDLSPNERLVELEIARDLGTNRAVVRGALTQLEQQRLVVREPNRGVRVRVYRADEAAEILETRALLEGLVARRAAERISDAGVVALAKIIDAMRALQSAGDLLGYSQLNARFHREILVIAQHETAAMLLAVLQTQAVRYQYRTVLQPGRPALSLAEHEAIFAALRSRDGVAAEQAMLAHVSAVIAVVRAIGGRDSYALNTG